MIKTLLSSYESIIALNGNKPGEELLEKIRKDVPMIAADGAALWAQGDYIVGDMDSFPLARAARGVEIISSTDQETTDFEKCIRHAEKKRLLPSLIIGINGGEIDHTLGNIQVLLKCALDLSLFFLDDSNKTLKIGLPLAAGTFTVETEPGATISILPFCSCLLSTDGLFWELHSQVLTPDGLLAVRNRAVGEQVTLDIRKGKALVTIDLNGGKWGLNHS